jgi:hypothetical protein
MAPNLWNEIHLEPEVILHDLCQPLTTLRCRLELAMMQQDHSVTHPEELCEAVQGGLQDLRAIFESVERLRQSLLAERRQGRQATSS